MLSKPDALNALKALINERKMVTLPAILTLLETKSRMSAHRRLRELNYLTSFSHTGRHYTLRSVANFNPQGLWFYQGVGFSRFGNLKETVFQLVEDSKAGNSHEELEKQLHLRVRNTLLDLIRSKRLTREDIGGLYLYLSGSADRAEQQLILHREGAASKEQEILSDELIIEVLAEIIRANRVEIDHRTLKKRLAMRGFRVSLSQLKQLCAKLALKKTVAFMS